MMQTQHESVPAIADLERAKSFACSRKTKAVIILVFFLLSLYVYCFFRFRKGLIYSGHPLTYVFSTDPVVHKRAIFIFRPLILVSGGQLQSQWDRRSEQEKLQFADSPMYPDSFTEDSFLTLDRWPEGGFDDPNPKYWLHGGHVPLLPGEENAQVVWDPDDIRRNEKTE
jgi:hypothetical protein